MSFPIPPAGITGASSWQAPDPLQSLPPVSYLADAIAPDVANFPNGASIRRADIVSPLRGSDPTDAAVLAAVLVRRGSGPAVNDIGNRLDRVNIARDNAADEIRLELLAALERLIDAGDIEDVTIDPNVDPENEQGDVVLVYTNVRTKQKGIRLPVSV